MAGELDDFLRRAAQRRVENATVKAEQRQRQQREAKRTRPEYTDSKQERRVANREESEDEPVIVADLIAEDLRSRHLTMSVGEAVAATMVAPAESAPQDVPVPRLLSSFDHEGARLQAAAENRISTPSYRVPQNAPTLAVLSMLRDSNGIRQAFLLREILDRPRHHW